ncbi:hypothetical protein ACVWW9_001587 [Agrococcus sp. UYP33]
MSNATEVALVWIEARGFRAFGTEVRRLDLSGPLVVIHAGNSQGKTSLAEAVEFLLTGRSSRRDLFGGAKAEYNASLRNAHLGDDEEVWVAAGIRDSMGVVHEVRRALQTDFVGASDCSSLLTIDGIAHDEIPDYGLSLGDGVMGAPVLLQHTLRYVLSTEPKQRAAYFKALLTLSDLDLLRQRIAAQRPRFDQAPDGPAVAAVRRLRHPSMTEAASALLAVDPESPTAQSNVEGALLSAGKGLVPNAPTVDAMRDSLATLISERSDRLFPLPAFVPTPASPARPDGPDFTPYTEALSEVDQAVATLLPAISALLNAPGYGQLEHAVDCPVCGQPESLTPDRIEILRAHLRAGEQLDRVTTDLRQAISATRTAWTSWLRAVEASLPDAAGWDESAYGEAAVKLVALFGEERSELRLARDHMAELKQAQRDIADRVDEVEASLAEINSAVERRIDLDIDLSDQVARVTSAVIAFDRVRERDESVEALRNLVGPELEDLKSTDGTAELLAVVDRAPELLDELREAAARRSVVKRLSAVDRALKTAASEVLDARFGHMSEAIGKWWSTIRPDELVGFAGVKRRAAGAIFVNLVAALQPQAQADPVERDALGVYSDSQLNALGLSTFLARADLTGCRTVVLDDPIPGSDGDHRLTFVQNTLGALLEKGRQVILTTYDPKLADWAAASHMGFEPLTFELSLLDATLGTEPTQTSDAFSRFMLHAEDSLNAPTAAGRRAACNAYRSAAERLAKQIIATNRSAAGTATTVGDVGREASQLGDLVPLVRGFALSNDEAGKWTVMPRVLNPGSHDDDVPSTIDLKQIRGNLREIAKNHRRQWPDGLER